jgi:ArsR family transcriptional regulator
MSIAEHNTIVLEPRRALGQGCCETVPPRLHDDEARAAADLFKALADPARLQILDVLSQRAGLVCVCDLEGVVGLPDADGQRPKQSTISHHLRVLRDAGLVGYEKQGQWAYYFIHRDRLTDVQALLSRLHTA